MTILANHYAPFALHFLILGNDTLIVADNRKAIADKAESLKGHFPNQSIGSVPSSERVTFAMGEAFADLPQFDFIDALVNLI